MPLFRVKDQLCYFAHVPKCAGMAIELYLEARFGTIGLRDDAYLSVRPSRRWTKSSPQHMDAAALARLLPPSYLHASFTVVRHPDKRLLSVFLYQRDIERTLPADIEFGAFLADVPRRWKRNPFYLDNHPRPMTDLVPEDTTVFRLEDGTQPIVDWLDQLAGNSDGPPDIPVINGYRQQLYHHRLVPGPDTKLTSDHRALIAEIYAADFERFGYMPGGGIKKGWRP